MCNSLTIGFFDSGIGGLSVLRECKKLLSAYGVSANFIYYADNANLPFGNKTESEIIQIATEGIKKLLEYQPKVIVLACNTVSLIAYPHLQRLYPPHIPTIPIIPVTPPIKHARALDTSAHTQTQSNSKTMILATRASLNSRAFANHFKDANLADYLLVSGENLARVIETNLNPKNITDPNITPRTHADVLNDRGTHRYVSTGRGGRGDGVNDHYFTTTPSHPIKRNCADLNVITAYIYSILLPYKKYFDSQQITKIILGCTHYSLVKPQIQQAIISLSAKANKLGHVDVFSDPKIQNIQLIDNTKQIAHTLYKTLLTQTNPQITQPPKFVFSNPNENIQKLAESLFNN
ncbi:MAG: hypothetical protein FWB72_04740 [Firmicutes bacterium]|nr:hypothetical protein [Bacillota bacterium]